MAQQKQPLWSVETPSRTGSLLFFFRNGGLFDFLDKAIPFLISGG